VISGRASERKRTIHMAARPGDEMERHVVMAYIVKQKKFTVFSGFITPWVACVRTSQTYHVRATLLQRRQTQSCVSSITGFRLPWTVNTTQLRSS